MSGAGGTVTSGAGGTVTVPSVGDPGAGVGTTVSVSVSVVCVVVVVVVVVVVSSVSSSPPQAVSKEATAIPDASASRDVVDALREFM